MASGEDSADYEPVDGDSSSLEIVEAGERSEIRGRVRSSRARSVKQDVSPLPEKPTSKRQRSERGVAYQPHKRPRPHNDEYRRLLNVEIEDAIARADLDEESPPLPASQIGLTRWTSVEKDVFFDALSRRGRDDMEGLAAAIGTKSALEIHVYLRLLQQGVVEATLEGARTDLLAPADLPASWEIGDSCCTALERASDALSERQERHETELERARWGDLWCLTAETASMIKARVKEGGDGLSEIEARIPAAALLKLERFLQLSERIFMNASDETEHENWRAHAGLDELPSIRCTAFTDLHMLAISLTKRLVQATLFFARSRLRAMDSSLFRPKPVVTAKDVHGALQVLGIKQNTHHFWATAARRCHLDVYDEENGWLEYEAVEQRLGKCGAMPRRESSASRGPSPAGCHVSDSYSEAHSDPSPSPSPSPTSSLPNLSAASAADDHYTEEDEEEDDEDQHIDVQDHLASRAEENRLWEILGKGEGKVRAAGEEEPMETGFTLRARARARPRRKDGADLMTRKAWRDRVDFRSEWEG
ncbi:MAG: hypothetical protein M1838_004966 [Thelocarpon superellum]|nr:MAG: hypothetical protein M1838_004966 [Thelocarpon superellum]